MHLLCWKMSESFLTNYDAFPYLEIFQEMTRIKRDDMFV